MSEAKRHRDRECNLLCSINIYIFRVFFVSKCFKNTILLKVLKKVGGHKKISLFRCLYFLKHLLTIKIKNMLVKYQLVKRGKIFTNKKHYFYDHTLFTNKCYWFFDSIIY